MAATITLDEVRLSCSQCSLSELCLPRGLTEQEVADLEGVVDQKPPLNRDQMLYRSGDTFIAFYAVKSGALKTTITSADGEEQIPGADHAAEPVLLEDVQAVDPPLDHRRCCFADRRLWRHREHAANRPHGHRRHAH